MKRRYNKTQYQKHLKEISDLRSRIKELNEQISNCDSRIEHGAISCEFRSLQNEKNRLTARLNRLEALDITIIEDSKEQSDTVSVNRTYKVEITDDTYSDTRLYHLIEDDAEIDLTKDFTDPLTVREISLKSLVGRAINGRKIGEQFTICINDNPTTISILEEILETETEAEL